MLKLLQIWLLSAIFTFPIGSTPLSASADDKELKCKYSTTDWQPLDTKLYTCDIFSQAIDAPGYRIEYDPKYSEMVQGLRFTDNKNMNFLPDNIGEIFPNLIGLTGENSHLSIIRKNDLKGLKNLKFMRFTNSDIKVIEEKAFEGLTSLAELDLSDSDIRLIDETAFHGLTALKTIYLGANKLNYLDKRTFDGLTALESVSLELNHLEGIDDDLFKTNVKLSDIWLNKNKIVGINWKVFEHSENLGYVDLQENVCVDGVYDTTNFDDLKELLSTKCTSTDYVRNKIEKENLAEVKPINSPIPVREEYNFDGEVDTSYLTQYLRFIAPTEVTDRTEATAFNNDPLKKIINCKNVDLHWRMSNADFATCEIENQKIDGRGFKVTGYDGHSLKAMTMANNKHIKFLPDDIGKFAPNLFEFSAKNSSLVLLSRKNFANLKNLKSLNLADNKIKYIDSDAFDDLTSLEELDLSGNELETLDSDIFSKLKNLKSLRLSANKLHTLPPKIMRNLRNLVNVSLSHQQISSIDEKFFMTNGKLKNIWLNSNKLKSISPNMFDNMKALEYVDMRDNKCIDKVYDHTIFDSMKMEVLDKCGAGYVLKKGKKSESTTSKKKKKQKPPKEKKKKEKLPKVEKIDMDEEKEVMCEYEDIFWDYLNQTLRTCVIKEAIEDGNYFISANPLIFEDAIDSDTIEAISFANNKNIKFLPQNLGDVFPNLKVMTAENSGLTTIDPKSFKNMGKLKYLNLAGNQLSSLDPNPFVDLTSLEVLILDDNEFEEIEEEVFVYLKYLKRLKLKGNNFKEINKDWLKHLPELEEFYFDVVEDHEITSDIFQFNPKLSWAYLNGNYYDKDLNPIDDPYIKQPDVEKEEEITTVPPFIQKGVECDYEQIKSLKTGEVFLVCNIQSEQDIDRADFFFKPNPANSRVKKLVIKDNENVKFLPHNIGSSFPILDEISVDNSGLSYVSRKNFENLPYLKNLILTNNKLKAIEHDTFDDLPNLKTLDLQGNKMEIIEDGLFNQLSELKTLNLGSNNIHFIHPKTFKYLSTLKNIVLDGNSLSLLDYMVFKNNPNLEEISMENNPIESLSPKIFDKLKKLKSINLKGNKCIDGTFDQSNIAELKNHLAGNCKSDIKSELKEVYCDFRDIYPPYEETNKVCVIDEDQSIDEPGYKVSVDASIVDPIEVESFSISNNPRVKYLPWNVNMFPNLINYYASNSSLESIPRDAFKGLNSVKKLDLSKNAFKNFDPNVFTDLKSVEEIDLSDNNIEYIDEDLFSNFPDLKKISLKGNQIKKIHPNAFSNLPKIKVLELDQDVDDDVPISKGISVRKIAKTTDTPDESTEIYETIGKVKCEPQEYVESEWPTLDPTKICAVGRDQMIDDPNYSLLLESSAIEPSMIQMFSISYNPKIRYLPKNIGKHFPNLESFYATNGALEDISPDIFKGFTHVKKIDLSNNKLNSLNPKLLENLPSLEELDLNNNNIESIDDDFFEKTPHLKKISFVGNNIQNLNPKAFENLPNLETVDVDEDVDDTFLISRNIKVRKFRGREEVTSEQIPCELKEKEGTDEYTCTITEEAENEMNYAIKSTPYNDKVTSLVIKNNNKIKSLPNNMGKLFPNLEEFVVERTSVAEIPRTTFYRLPKIQKISLSHNKIREIDPHTFENLPDLNDLSLSHNLIEEIPETTFDLPSLENLQINNNKISYLYPKTFEKLPSLKWLAVDGNRDLNIEDEKLFSNNKNLDLVNLNDGTLFYDFFGKVNENDPRKRQVYCNYQLIKNSDDNDSYSCVIDQPITEDDFTFKTSPYDPKVKEMIILNNENVKHLPKYTGDRFPNLEVISVKNTKINEIPTDAFKNMDNLKTLVLSENEITNLKPKVFEGLPKVRELNLSGNKIEKIPETIFENVPNLENLDLSDNKITTIEPNTLKNLPKLKIFAVEGNEIPALDKDLFINNPDLQEIKFTPKPAEEVTTSESFVITSTPKQNGSGPSTKQPTKKPIHTLHGEKSTTTATPETTTKKDVTTLKPPPRKTTATPKVTTKRPTGHKTTRKPASTTQKPATEEPTTKISALPSTTPKRTSEIACEFSLVPYEPDGKELFTCDLKGEYIEDPEISLPNVPVGADVKVLRLDNNKNIKYLPDNIANVFPNLVKLIATNSSIDSILPGDLEDLKHVETIDLSGNEIKTIEPETFSLLPSLEELDLSDNKIEDIDEDSFVKLPKLNKLKLENNKITYLNPKTFEQLPNLEILNVEDNDIQSLWEGTFNKNPKLKTVTHSIKGFEFPITTTTTSSTTQRSIPTRKSASTERIISTRKTTTAPTTTTERYPLTEIECEYDKIHWTYTDANLFSCDLKNVIIDHPNYVIKDSPRNRRVRGLSFVDNQNAHYLPKNIGEVFPNLEEFSAYNTSIRDIPKDIFNNLQRVKSLNFMSSKIEKIDPDALDNLYSLENLDLADNNLREIHPDTFKNNPYLKNVFLAKNGIQNIDPRTFENLPDLRNISLDSNYLMEIDPHLFRNNDELKNIWLNGNRINAIDPRTFEGKRRLEYVDLRDNDCINELFEDYGLENMRNRIREQCRLPFETNIIDSNVIPTYEQVTERATTTTTSATSRTWYPIPTVKTPTKEVPCKLEYDHSEALNMHLFTCFVQEEPIEDQGFTIASTPYDPHVTGVNFDDNPKVKFLPDNIGDQFPNLLKLSAKNTSLTDIIPDTLKNLPALQLLDLSNNDLSIIDQEVFKNIPKLKELDLSDNNVPIILNDTFNNLPNIESLNLARNELSELNSDVFKKLPKMKKLSLENNNLYGLPSQIFEENPDLEEINLSGNNINYLHPEIFDNLNNLKSVNLMENDCINGHYNRNSFHAMKVDLARNCVPSQGPRTTTELPKQQPFIPTPEEIRPEKPAIMEVDCDLTDTYSEATNDYITTCTIDQNKGIVDPKWRIRESPSNRRVKRFVIQNNPDIESLPVNMAAAFPELTELSVENTGVKEVDPESLRNLRDLKRIDMPRNSIKYLEPEMFRETPNVEKIDLSDNNLRHIDERAFSGLPNLKTLDLSHNKLPKIDSTVLSHLPELRTLKLPGNDLREVNGELFKHNPKLYEVNLSQNNIKSINPDAFDRLPHLVNLDLSKNECMDRSFGTSSMHLLRNVVNEHCQPHELLKTELKACKKEVENCKKTKATKGTTRALPSNVKELKRLRDAAQKAEAKYKNLNIQVNKIRNLLRNEKAALAKEKEKSKNLEIQLLNAPRNCAKIDDSHNFLVDLNCDFIENQDGYTCRVKDLKIGGENTTIENVLGSHARNKKTPDVTSLIISNQDIKFLPQNLNEHFPYLTDIIIDNSKLSKLNRAFTNLPYLKKLSIIDNDIHSIDPNAFNDATELEYVDLSRNNLKELPTRVFEKLPNLRVVNIRDNGLMSLPQDILPNYNNVNEFVASNNDFNFIDPRIFKKLPRTQVVDLTNSNCVDGRYDGNENERSALMALVGEVSIKCTNNEIGEEDKFCPGRKFSETL